MDEKQVHESMVPESLAYVNLGPSIDDLIDFCDSKRTRCTGAAQKLMTEFHYPYESEDVTRYLDEASYYGQIITKLEDLKSYKENDKDKDEFYEWVYRKDTDRLHCSNCGASSSYDSYGPIQTPYCCYCGKKMLKSWDYHDTRRVDING